MDEANGYDFTGKGIFDSEGNEITGYAYVGSENYPYVIAKFYGSVRGCPFTDYDGEIGDGISGSGSNTIKFRIIGFILLVVLFSLFWMYFYIILFHVYILLK